jgi:retron-type reverse transcriptase
MIDLKRAFETINRDLLLQKLELYKVGGTVIKRIRSYLTGRTQVVKIDNETSNEIPCDTGVPQGSVLSSVLYNLCK